MTVSYFEWLGEYLKRGIYMRRCIEVEGLVLGTMNFILFLKVNLDGVSIQDLFFHAIKDISSR